MGSIGLYQGNHYRTPKGYVAAGNRSHTPNGRL
nr:MAG TPA: hypothetical protein [Caudoviricetes sp.]